MTMISILRSRRVSGILFLGLFLCSFSLHSQSPDSTTTVILVRHAEKDTVGVNPPLIRRGLERAEALAHVLSGMPVSTIYTTQFLRTQQTAQPIAEHCGVKPRIFDMNLSAPRAAARALAEDIVKNHKGETVLVSNHGNVIPFIIEALGAGRIGDISDRVYDNLFIVLRRSSGETKLLKLKYGTPSD